MASPAYAVTVSIDGPPPSAPALTLVGASRVIPVTDDRWINGATIWPYGSDLPFAWDLLCSPPAGPPGGGGREVMIFSSSSAAVPKAEGTPTVPETFGSFAVVQAITCTTRSIGNPAEWQARADRLLQAREHWAIEREFWTGALKPDNPHLAQPDADDLFSGAATNTANALSLLEQAIADAGGDGMIHLRPGVFSLIAQEGGITISNGVAKTPLGTRIVPGVGYTGTDPDGNTLVGDNEWAYASGPVEIRRSETFIVPGSISEATDRAQNVTTFRAERYILITWDQRIHADVKIDRSFTNFTS